MFLFDVRPYCPTTFRVGLAAGYPSSRWATVERIPMHGSEPLVVVWQSTHRIVGDRLVAPRPDCEPIAIEIPSAEMERWQWSEREHYELSREVLEGLDLGYVPVLRAPTAEEREQLTARMAR